MKRALVCGAGGFVGNHLVRQLKTEGYFVRGVDLKKPQFSKTQANEFKILDLRLRQNCRKALNIPGGFDEVYQLAADRGGAGYMIPGECDMMENNALINIYMISETARLRKKPIYFFSSSVCIYQNMPIGAARISETQAYPALPENEYGWEKLYSERMVSAFGRKFNIPVRIARFHTTFGPQANWEGGREKAADALCRKTALAKNGTNIEVWGDGKAVRVFTYIEDLISGIRHLVKSQIDTPTNIGTDEYVTVRELAEKIIKISGKKLKVKWVKGAVGVAARNFSSRQIRSTGWKPKFTLEAGLKIHYSWVAAQAHRKYGAPK